jgi:hypothetical protein
MEFIALGKVPNGTESIWQNGSKGTAGHPAVM